MELSLKGAWFPIRTGIFTAQLDMGEAEQPVKVAAARCTRSRLDHHECRGEECGRANIKKE
jgi:hypothetical protein